MPSFGVWGFVLARPTAFEIPTEVPEGLRFLNKESIAGLFSFPADISRVPAEVNRLNDQRLVRYYESEWRHWE